MRGRSLPGLAGVLLRQLLPVEARVTVIAELAEEYGARVHQSGSRTVARLWLWREALSLVLAYLRVSLLRGRSREVTIVNDARRQRWRSSRHGASAERERRFGAIGQDVRHGVRSLRHRPAFTAAAVATIAIGIGANATILMIMQGSMLRPLPYPEAHELVHIHHLAPEYGLSMMGLSAPDYYELKKNNRSLQGLAAYRTEDMTMTGRGEPRRLQAAVVSHDFFAVLRVPPYVGRAFVAEEETEAAEPVVILSQRLWESVFGASPHQVGEHIRLENEDYLVVGIMLSGFTYPQDSEIWVPMRLSPDLAADRDSGMLWGIGRMREGSTLREVRSDLEQVQGAINEQYPEMDEVLIGALGLRRFLYREMAGMLLFFYSIVTLVLLLACANTANLMLAFYSSREGEFGIRASLGSGRGRIVRQVLTESLLLATLGGAIGVGIGLAGRSIMLAYVPVPIPDHMAFGFSLRVLLLLAAVIGLVSVLSGTAPALASGSISPAAALAPATARATADRKKGRLRSALVFSEITLAALILVTAAMLFQSHTRFQQTDPGFDTEGILTARIDLPENTYPDGSQRQRFFADLVDRLGELPGVTSAGAAQELPLGHTRWGRYYYVEGAPPPQPGDRNIVYFWLVEGDYLEAMGLQLLQGRSFSSLNPEEEQEQVLVVSSVFARRWWPEGDAVGKRMKWGPPDSENPWMTVIGVVEDVDERIPGSEPDPGCYIPLRSDTPNGMYLALHTDGDPADLVDPLKAAVWRDDPDLPLVEIRPIEAIMREQYWPMVLGIWLMGIFSFITLSLAAVGIYAVVSYSVSRRTREMGIRIAMGAGSGQIVRTVVGRVIRTSGTGLAAGMLLAFVALRILSSQLYGIVADDLATYLMVTAVLGGAALLAGWLPARRAVRIDPMEALRSE